MVGQQSSYTVKEKFALIAQDLDTKWVKKQTPQTLPQNTPKTLVPRQLGEKRVKRRYLPPHAQPFSSMNHYPVSKSPFGPISSV